MRKPIKIAVGILVAIVLPISILQTKTFVNVLGGSKEKAVVVSVKRGTGTGRTKHRYSYKIISGQYGEKLFTNQPSGILYDKDETITVRVSEDGKDSSISLVDHDSFMGVFMLTGCVIIIGAFVRGRIKKS